MVVNRIRIKILFTLIENTKIYYVRRHTYTKQYIRFSIFLVILKKIIKYTDKRLYADIHIYIYINSQIREKPSMDQ